MRKSDDWRNWKSRIDDFVTLDDKSTTIAMDQILPTDFLAFLPQ